jgi:hypothetical protein
MFTAKSSVRVKSCHRFFPHTPPIITFAVMGKIYLEFVASSDVTTVLINKTLLACN